MASQVLHEEKALKFQKALQDLPETHLEWQITLRFYIAVHWIRAFMAYHGNFSGFKDEPNYGVFAGYLVPKGQEETSEVFLELKQLSQLARYRCLEDAQYAKMMGSAIRHYDTIQANLKKAGVNTGV